MENSSFIRRLNVTKPSGNGVVIDMGAGYTQIGFLGDNAPKRIIPTPQSILINFRNLCPKPNLIKGKQQKTSENLSQQTIIELQNKIHDFFYQIFIKDVLIVLKDKVVYLVQNLLMPRLFIELLSSIFFDNFYCKQIVYLLSNTLPLYLSGSHSGIVVECGFTDTQITPFYQGYLIKSAFKHYSVGGHAINLQLRERLWKDNEDQKSIETNAEIYEKLPVQRLQDMKFKFAQTLTIGQKAQFFIGDLSSRSDNENVKKAKSTLIETNIMVRKGKKLKISYLTSLSVHEVMFGNVENEQQNIAYGFLKSLKSVQENIRGVVCQNTILSGGLFSVQNFAIRFREEIMNFLEVYEEFKGIKQLVQQKMKFTNLQYIPNLYCWIGASIVSLMSSAFVDQFSLTRESFTSLKDQQFPDIYGDAILNATQISKNSKLETELKSENSSVNENIVNNITNSLSAAKQLVNQTD